MTAVADDHGGLPAPLVEQVVDGVLDGGRVAPVVLGQDEDEGGVLLDLAAPGARVRLAVVGGVGDLGGDGGFVEEGEVPGGQVDEVEFGGRGWVGGVGGGGGGGVGWGFNGFGDKGSYLGADAWLS